MKRLRVQPSENMLVNALESYFPWVLIQLILDYALHKEFPCCLFGFHYTLDKHGTRKRAARLMTYWRDTLLVEHPGLTLTFLHPEWMFKIDFSSQLRPWLHGETIDLKGETPAEMNIRRGGFSTHRHLSWVHNVQDLIDNKKNRPVWILPSVFKQGKQYKEQYSLSNSTTNSPVEFFNDVLVLNRL